ncbi:MAG: histidine phosphatase family protein [Verrucomicrobiota bacterium]
MKLLLVRHADADVPAETDAARPLSEKGHKQAQQVANFLKSYPLAPQLVLSSTAIRAAETAQPIARALGIDVIPCGWARPGMLPDEAIQELQPYARFKELVLVGHQPDLALLTARLIGLPQPARVHVRKASIIHLNLTSPSSALLEALIPCHLP